MLGRDSVGKSAHNDLTGRLSLQNGSHLTGTTTRTTRGSIEAHIPPPPRR